MLNGAISETPRRAGWSRASTSLHTALRPGLLSRSPWCYCIANLNTSNGFFFCACAPQRTHHVNLRSIPPAGPWSGVRREISQPKRNQRFYTADRPQAELAFYLQFVLPRYCVGQISNVVILNLALESEKV